jgi:hypothetical protein
VAAGEVVGAALSTATGCDWNKVSRARGR